MGWRLPQRALHPSALRGPAGRGRWALVASLAVHLALGWLFFAKKAARPASLPDVVEVAFEIQDVAAALPASAPAPEGSAAGAGMAPSTRASGRTGAEIHGEMTGARAGAVATPASVGEAQVPDLRAPGASASGDSNRFSTFQPAHPDLLGPGKFPPLDAQPRDLLASPLAKGGAAPRELPKVLHGSGGVTARVAEDGSIHFRDPHGVVVDDSPFQAVGSGVGAGVSGHFDLTDQVMKHAGQDPYAPSKRAIADETREQRLCMAMRYQGERRKQELFNLATKVRRLAARVDLSLAERREIVFDIWDECTEEAESGTDYGAMARSTILAVARDVFPAGSERAYQPAELLALNQRRSSRQRFAPYDPISSSSRKRDRHPDAGAPSECPMP